jgi:hypothetical protein
MGCPHRRPKQYRARVGPPDKGVLATEYFRQQDAFFIWMFR